MSITRPIRKKITPLEFVQKMQAQATIIQTANKVITRLEKLYVEAYCPHSIGQTITLPKQTEEKYTHFLIADIQTEIHRQEVKSNIIGAKPKINYKVGFILIGIFKAEGIEDKEGRIKFTVNDEPTLQNEQLQNEETNNPEIIPDKQG